MDNIYNLLKSIDFNDKIIKKENTTPTQINKMKTIISSSSFFSSKNIKKLNDYIKNNKFYSYDINLKIKGKNTEIVIISSLKINSIRILYKYLKILFTLYIHKNDSLLDKIYIHIIPINIKKFLPDNNKTLTSEHINSAFSYINYYKKGGDIYIYRKEELKKVFVHELLHTLHQDHQLIFNNINIDEFKKIKKLNINESLNETCSVVLTVYIKSYLDTNSYKDFCLSVKKYLKKELEYSLYNTKKIMNHNNFSNLDMFLGKKYKQNASVFSYVILKSSILFYLYNNNDTNLCDWCINHKKNNFTEYFRKLILDAFKNENWRFSVYSKKVKRNISNFKMTIF